MFWKDEGYLLHKNNYDENSIIIEAFTLNHGKSTGIVYGGASRKLKKNFQIGNKISLNSKSKGENKISYFTVELIKPIAPSYFEDKKRSICILSASSILKILLPDRQINKNIYLSFDSMFNNLHLSNWITSYIHWELFLIKELGFDMNLNIKKNIKNNTSSIEINGKIYNIPKILYNSIDIANNSQIKEALEFNRSLIMENFIIPNQLRFPLSRNLLEKYYN